MKHIWDSFRDGAQKGQEAEISLTVSSPLTKEQKTQLAEQSEQCFAAHLERTAQQLAAQQALRVIWLSGPTCSGKTTTASMLCERLLRLGHRVHAVSIDDYYLDRSLLTARAGNADVDYESVQAIDFTALGQTLERILTLQKLSLPVYDFLSGKRVGYQDVEPEKGDIFLFEGIQAIYPQITALIPRCNACGIFISPGSIRVNGVLFCAEELRLMRRIVRDAKFRGVKAEQTLALWESVRKNEDKNIFPYTDALDIHISSSFAYELFVIKPLLEQELSNAAILDGTPGALARRLLEKISALPRMEMSFVPRDSMFREFIGE